MIQKTLMIFGPGGIGKSSLDDIIRRDALRIDPYRLREKPRDSKENGGKPDFFYAHRNLYSEISSAFIALGDRVERLSAKPVVEWFPKTRTTFFSVRGEWQCLLLGSLNAQFAKAEIFAPAVNVLFQQQNIRQLFGNVSILILNPGRSLRECNGNYDSLKKSTAKNCKMAGRCDKEIKKRCDFIDDEVSVWLAMLDTCDAIEFSEWRFPEHVYKTNRALMLIEARKTLLSSAPSLGVFFKEEDEIRVVVEP